MYRYRWLWHPLGLRLGSDWLLSLAGFDRLDNHGQVVARRERVGVLVAEQPAQGLEHRLLMAARPAEVSVLQGNGGVLRRQLRASLPSSVVVLPAPHPRPLALQMGTNNAREFHERTGAADDVHWPTWSAARQYREAYRSRAPRGRRGRCVAALKERDLKCDIKTVARARSPNHTNLVTPLTAKRLVHIRSGLDLTQEKMAALLGCSWVSVSRWEKGHSSPLPAVADIYRALDAALQGGHPAAEIIQASQAARGSFLQSLFTMAYPPR